MSAYRDGGDERAERPQARPRRKGALGVSLGL